MVKKIKKKFFVKHKVELLFWIIVLAVVFLDQISKYLISLIKPVWDIGFLKISFIKNTGAGFGILKDQTIWLALISLIVALAIIFYYQKIPKQKLPQILSALFLGGVIGNLIDRVFRSYVIDFINFKVWPAFNIADACISVAVIGLIVWLWKN